MRDQIVDGAAESRPADIEQCDLVGEACDLLEALRRPQHRDRPLSGNACDQRPYASRPFRVEVVCCLVDQEDRRVAEEGACQRQAALHALGEQPGPLALLGCEPDRLQAGAGAVDGIAAS